MISEHKIINATLEEVFYTITEMKWHAVFLNSSRYNYKEMSDWLNDNCESRVRYVAAGFSFEDDDDAFMFILRWL